MPANEICSLTSAGHDLFSQRDAIVWQKHQLQLSVDVRIAIDDFGNLVEQFDDQLRHRISGRSFATDDEGARDKWGGLIFLQR